MPVSLRSFLDKALPTKPKSANKDRTQHVPELDGISALLSTILMAMSELNSLSKSAKLESFIKKITVLQTVLCLVSIMSRIRSMFVEEGESSLKPSDKILHEHGYLTMSESENGGVGYGSYNPFSQATFISLRHFLAYTTSNANVIHTIGASGTPGEDMSDVITSYVIGDKWALLKETVIIAKFPQYPDIKVAVLVGGADIDRIKFISRKCDRLDHMAICALSKDIQREILASIKENIVHLSMRHDYMSSMQMSLTPLEPAKYNDADKVSYLSKLLTTAFDRKEKLSAILYGLPGVGKSSTILTSLANSGALVFAIDDQIEYEDLHALIKDLPGDKVLLIEDLSSQGTGRDGSAFTDMLKILDSDMYSAAIMTTNSTKLPPALVRSGRCDIRIRFDLPDEPERSLIMHNLAKQYGYEPNANLIMLTDGLTHADLNALYRLASLHNISPDEYLPEYLKSHEDFRNFDEEGGNYDE